MRRQYPFHLIEPKWQQFWEQRQSFRAFNPNEEIPAGHPFAQRHNISGKVAAAQLPPKYYILDMFPYPSGAGLHVGHPEGYTATDILARYRRAKGFNVLHPMGWDAFGLPAEQYAVKTGQHPRKTTEENIATFKRQIKSLGFSYDWSREVDTTDPKYFKWTQWIFLKLYNSWYNPKTSKAEPIETLEYPAELERAAEFHSAVPSSTTDCRVQLGSTLEQRRRNFRDSKRLAYVAEAPVNWCEELGTVLANEEVIDGKSDVGGFPVVRKPMRQWMLRITAYAERLLNDLESIEWSHSLKEMQRNWIGRSEGAEVDFAIADCRLPIADSKIRVFTTRPDTLFGATYMVLSPEHKLLSQITTAAQRKAVENYKSFASGKSDLERTELAKEKTGVFTGACAINPVNGEKIPIWIADYVLATYGTGAIMAVPAHDERDFAFAKRFKLPVKAVVQPPLEWFADYNYEKEPGYPPLSPDEQKKALTTVQSLYARDPGMIPVAFIGEGIAINSPLFDNLPTTEAKKKITDWLESKGLGKKTINYKLRDWLFSRQRYWGEPFPIIWKRDENGNLFHEALPEKSLPLIPPVLDDYKPTPDGQPPLARAKDWVELKNGAMRETNTMPQWAGSCWYYLRYLDAGNEHRFVSREAQQYWMGAERPAGVFPLISPNDWHSQVENLWRRAFVDGKRPPFAIEYARVSPEFARRVREISGMEVSEFRHSLDVYAVRHIFNQHGIPAIEEARGNIALEIADVERLPEILAEPDSIEFAAKHPRGFKRFITSKRINGFIYIIEEARTRHGQLQLVTMHKKKATARDVTPKAPLSDTSETFRRTDENIKLQLASGNPQFTTSGVDLYVGGTEHAVLHLLYARFWHKVLFDLGYVSTPEPFFKLVNQGLILGEDGQKMSKSRGNVVNPDDIMGEYGADALRLYEMFMGPLEMVKPWNTHGVAGVYKFLGRVWRLFVDEKSEVEYEQAESTTEAQRHGELLEKIQLSAAIKDVIAAPAQLKTLHACIKKVTEDLDGMRFNTAISALMVFVNDAISWETKPVSVLRDFLILLQPFAPHLAEELWEKLNIEPPTSNAEHRIALAYTHWPKFDAAVLVENEIEIPVQVNGKLRDVIKVPADISQADLETAARASEKVKAFIDGKTIKKVIVVPKKLVNIAVA